MTRLLVGTLVAGTATIGAGLVLDKVRERTGFRSSTTMSRFLMGCTAQLMVVVATTLLYTSGPLAGLGEETVPELDAKIDAYQKHIAALKKIAQMGSSAGKAQALQKLPVEARALQILLSRREDLVND